MMSRNPEWLEEIPLASGVRVFYTNRGTVRDRSPYSSFNICHYTGDDTAHVAECRRLLADTLPVSENCIVVPRQTHSVRCVVIDEMPSEPLDLEGVDALVTCVRGLVIGVSTADCVPVVMCDSDAGVLGVAHAGWRGAVGGVVRNTLVDMVARGAVPQRIKATFGPSIHSCCFEVGDEVASEFPECNVIRKEGEKPHVDLQGYIVDSLVTEGIPCENIIKSDICTRCNSERYFSARALGIKSGRIFTFAYLQ